jgi:hypothetical protein
MPYYNCIPAAKTVPPCPTGTAPNNVGINTTQVAEYYPAVFDKMAEQDILFVGILFLSFAIGFGSGKK